jgi:hypothetical protein
MPNGIFGMDSRDGRTIAALNLNPHGAVQSLNKLLSLHLAELNKTARRIEKELLGNIVNFET